MKRYYPSRTLRAGEGITVKPGGMVMGRTFEKFTIPNGNAGKIEGRSTFARLGLSVHCTGDFINPGWRGRMPLQLVNHSRVAITLTPYLPICQLVVMKVSEKSEKPYGTDGLNSKYMDDKGEPSRFWADERIRKVQDACNKANLPEKVRTGFTAAVQQMDGDAVYRFLDFVQRMRSEEITSVREVLERFADKDTARAVSRERWLQFAKWFPLLPLTTSFGALLKKPYETEHFVFWTATALLLPIGIWAMFFSNKPAMPFTREMVDDYFTGCGNPDS